MERCVLAGVVGHCDDIHRVLGVASLRFAYANGWGTNADRVLFADLSQSGLKMEAIGIDVLLSGLSVSASNFMHSVHFQGLRLSALSASRTGSGYLVNLLSNDVGRLDMGFLFAHYIWILPFQVGGLGARDRENRN